MDEKDLDENKTKREEDRSPEAVEQPTERVTEPAVKPVRNAAQPVREDRDEFFDPPAPPPAAYAPYSFAAEPSPEEKKKKTRTRRIVAVILAIVLLGVGFLAGWMVRHYTLDPNIREFLWALDTAQRNYLYEIDEDRIYEEADVSEGAQGLLDALNGQLDAYSAYYTAEEYAAVIASGEGQNKGIGVSVYDVETELGIVPRIFSVVLNSPAQKAGLQKGMYICGYGTDPDAMARGDSEELTAFIRAQEGEFYLLASFGPDAEEGIAYRLTRLEYQAFYCSYRDSEGGFSIEGTAENAVITDNLEALEGLDDSTAYIRIDEFSGYAADEFVCFLDLMKERGRTDLIIDLRCNGGGYLSILQEMASHMLRNAQGSSPLVLTANYKNGTTVSYRATSGNDFSAYFSADSTITVLADENTASASEAFIGALLDYGTVDYGDIYLRQAEDGAASTYGKGIMQSFFPSLTGSAIKLTTATINWPLSGTCIHGVGITAADGANAVAADLVWGKEDVMLDYVVSQVCGEGGSVSLAA